MKFWWNTNRVLLEAYHVPANSHRLLMDQQLFILLRLMMIGLPQPPQTLTLPSAGGAGQCGNLGWGLQGDLARIIWSCKFQTSNFSIFIMTKQISLHGFSFPQGVFIFIIFQKAVKFAFILTKIIIPTKENFNLTSYSWWHRNVTEMIHMDYPNFHISSSCFNGNMLFGTGTYSDLSLFKAVESLMP